jgi:hypothetical protein
MEPVQGRVMSSVGDIQWDHETGVLFNDYTHRICGNNL